MNLQKKTSLTPRGRALLIQRIHNGLRVEEAEQAAGGERPHGLQVAPTLS